MIISEYVTAEWVGGTKKYYESLGYVFTKIGDKFQVKVSDLKENSGQIIKVACDLCGAESELTLQMYTKNIKANNGIYRCKNCMYKDRGHKKLLKYAKINIDIFNDYCHDNGYVPITTINEYPGINGDVEFICPRHGKQKLLLSNIIHNNARCYRCGKESVSHTRTLSKETVKERVEKYNNNILVNPEDYVNTNIKNLNIICGNCGNVFTTSLSSYLNSEIRLCSKCIHQLSDGERKIIEYLDEYNIKYIHQKRFDDCKDIKTLPFDFYLPEYNTIIEFDGQQHYLPKYGEDHLFITQKHDKIKNEYCEKNDIKLIRIPYWEGNNMETIIKNELNIA